MKKFLVSTIIFSMILLCFSYISFAANLTNGTKNTMNNIGNAIANTSNIAKNTVQNAKNTIVNSSENVTNGVANAANTVVSNADNANTNYNATRTSTNTGFLGMNATNWTWVILAIVGIAIVGLVWYYGSQYEHTDYSDGE